jgi:hypothetical protein
MPTGAAAEFVSPVALSPASNRTSGWETTGLSFPSPNRRYGTGAGMVLFWLPGLFMLGTIVVCIVLASYALGTDELSESKAQK